MCYMFSKGSGFKPLISQVFCVEVACLPYLCRGPNPHASFQIPKTYILVDWLLWTECGVTMTMNGCLFSPIKDLETCPGWRWVAVVEEVEQVVH